MCECAHNILKGNVPLKNSHKGRLRQYKNDLQALVKRKTALHERKRILQKGGFVGALLAPLAKSLLASWLLACFSSKDSAMDYAKKMALVDPRMLESVPSHTLSTNPIGNIMRRIDDEMRFILDRGDLNDREKVVLYNQVLTRYNLFSNKASQQPVRVIIDKAPVKEDEEDKETRAEPGVEKDIIDSVPKSLKQRARRLLDKMKGTMSWNDRGEIVYRNAPVPESNM